MVWYYLGKVALYDGSSEAWGNRLFTSGNLAIFCKKLNNYIGLHVINTSCAENINIIVVS